MAELFRLNDDDLLSLSPEQWFNDNIINYYFQSIGLTSVVNGETSWPSIWNFVNQLSRRSLSMFRLDGSHYILLLKEV